MYSVSNTYKNKIASGAMQFNVYGTIGSENITASNVMSLSITNQCSSESEVKIGQVYVGQLNMTVVNTEFTVRSLIGLPITLYAGVLLSGTTYEYVPLGIYYIDSAMWTQSGIEIVAYDSMGNFDAEVSTTLSGTPYSILSACCTACNVTLGMTSAQVQALPNGSFSASCYATNDITTYRDVISWVAQFMGCYATIDRSGQLVLRKYGTSAVETINSSRRHTGASFSDYVTFYTSVVITDIETGAETQYALPTDNGLSYALGSNPYLQTFADNNTKATVFNNLLNAVTAFEYVPFTASLAPDPKYDLGDVLVFSDGIADATAKYCVTKFEWTYNNKNTLSGTGRNAAYRDQTASPTKLMTLLGRRIESLPTTAIVYLYQRSASTPSKPSNTLTYTFATNTLSGTIDHGWQITIPSGTNPLYVIAATAVSTTATDEIESSDWSSPVIMAQDGGSGTPGMNTATVYLYQRASSTPSKPSNTLTYTFSTKTLSGTINNGWNKTVPNPDGDKPLYITFATAASTTDTDAIESSEWATAAILAENGEQGPEGPEGPEGPQGPSGLNSATVFLYQRATSTPSTPSSNLTYKFSDGSITGTLGNWSASIPSGTNPIYVTIATAAANTATDTIAPADWTTPNILAQNGGSGVGISSVTELYYSKANTTAPAAPTSTVTTNNPATQNAWNKALPTYSASYPHYFTCSEILYTNGTRNWTTPVYAGALTTANQTAASANSTATTANNTANTANNTANAAKDKIDNLEVGARNLFIAYDALPSAKRFINNATGYTYDPDTGTYVVKQTAASSGFIQIYAVDAVTEPTQIAGKEVTLSARSITSSRAAADARIYLCVTKSGGTTYTTYLTRSTLKATVTLPSDTAQVGYVLRLDQNNAGSTGETLTIVGLKLELGNMATDWTPAPEDTLAEIANVEIGGRNLSTGTGTAKGFTPTSGQTYFAPLGFYPVGDYGVSLIRGATTEDEWVVSFDYAVTGAATATQIYVSMNRTASSYTAVSPDAIDVPVGNSSGHFSTVFQLTAEQITYGNKWLLSKTNNTDTAIRVTLSNFMFEKGNRASSWSPAPEDVEEAIEAVEDTATEALNKHGFCSCSTAASTQAKTATLTGFQLKTGSTVHVTFTNANSKANATLNINSTGAKTIKWNGQSLTATESPWAAGECVTFVYDGTYWVVSGQSNITADNIVSGSITADRIKANVISAVNNGTGSINADKIKANVISAVNSGTGTINADKINIGIGGRNYLRNSNNYVAWYRPDAAASYITATSDYIKFTPPATAQWWVIEPLPIQITMNDWDTTAQYTFSVDCKIEGKTGSPDNPIVSVATKSSTNGGYGSRVRELGLINFATVATSSWGRYTFTFSGDYTTWTSRDTATPVCVTIYIWLHNTSSQYTAVYFRNIKLEKGNMATDWSPAPADSAATATNYITNISGGGITVTGNSASSKIQIASTVKVIKDTTHFTEMTASDFNVYSGNATYPVAKLAQNGASLSGDGAGVYLARILKAAFIDAQTTYGGMFELNNTSGGVGVRIYAGPSYGTQLFYNSSDKMLLRIGANDTGQGEVSVFKATSSTSTIAAKIGTLTVTSGGNTLVNNEPTLAFYNNGTMMSWYSLKRAFISDGTRAGYVVYGNTANHGFNIDYLTTGRINFYVDGTSIGYATITSSDERMKTDINPIDERYKEAIANVELKNFHFDFNDATRSGANLLERFGAIAQDVISALENEGLDYRDSELVETLEDDDGEYYTINYVPFLIARLAADEDRIKQLEDRIAALEARLED